MIMEPDLKAKTKTIKNITKHVDSVLTQSQPFFGIGLDSKSNLFWSLDSDLSHLQYWIFCSLPIMSQVIIQLNGTNFLTLANQAT